MNREEKFMQFALSLKDLSKCSDKHVAAVITDKDMTQVYSIGINGGPKKGLDCLCKLGEKYSCIHAEAQAIAKNTSSDSDKIMFCTFSPCVTCAALIINTGFSKVYYFEKYKSDEGLNLLKNAGIDVRQLAPLEKSAEGTPLYDEKYVDNMLAVVNEKTLVITRLIDKLVDAKKKECIAKCPYKSAERLVQKPTNCSDCEACKERWYEAYKRKLYKEYLEG